VQPPDPPAPAEPPRPVHTAPPAAHEPAARNIQLEVGAGERKIEVRLQERAGEVRLAVRTPDGNLAETLRDHLPSLSARLEQSGFHADQWRAGEAGGHLRALEVEKGQARSSRDSDPSSRGNGGQPDPRDSSREREQPHRDPSRNRVQNQKGKGFAWFMSSQQ
jgi:hypothetical protein